MTEFSREKPLPLLKTLPCFAESVSHFSPLLERISMQLILQSLSQKKDISYSCEGHALSIETV